MSNPIVMDHLWMLTSFGDFLSDRDSYFEVFFCILCIFRLFTTQVHICLNLLFLCAGSTRLLCVCERDLMRGFECGLFLKSVLRVGGVGNPVGQKYGSNKREAQQSDTIYLKIEYRASHTSS